ncbi:MAG: C4-dicarboxylate ABC transporter substrate-binding protein [Proteobacteria bacterium]|nr:C4-dicarboxylate ABC transporter substrate-binding protein [Pseudomonadota bacterium]
MKRLLLAGAAMLLIVGGAQAQNRTLTMTFAQPGGASDVSAKNLAELASADKIATIQVQGGGVLTKTIQQVAEGKTDISPSAFILNFLMSKGLGPFSGVGKAKGKEFADNLRLLYPYHLASFYLIAFQSTGIDSYEKLAGKTVHNGPPRGGALVTARNVIRLSAGLAEGKGYTGKQIAWGQANSIFLDRSVDAAVRPGSNPAPYMPVLLSAGKINIVSVPKARFEGEDWQKYAAAPGNVPNVFPVSELAHYGPNARIISDDNMFRTVANAGGDMVHKNMDKALAKALTATFIKNVPGLLKKVPFAKGQLFGVVDDKKMGMCNAGIKFHPGAIEAWEEAGHKIPDCAKPQS